MAETVAMPKLGFDMQEGTLVRWVRHEGETVEKGQVLAEIETDKATVEVESSFSGIIHKQMVQQGSVVPVGAPIAIIAAPGEKVDDEPSRGASAPAEDSTITKSAPAQIAPAAPQAAVEEGGRVKASPLARKFAQEYGISLSAVQGTGPSGRVTRKDVQAALAAPAAPVAVSVAPAHIQAPAAGAAPAAKPSAAPAVPLAPAVWGGASAPADERIGMDRLRQAIGRRMVESKTQLPHFYVTHAYNVEPLLALRSQVNAYLPEDQKITVNDFIVKATALALRQFPNLNASIAGTEIIRHGQINIGVAVAVGGGLLTIVTRDADLKPLRVISAQVKEMVARARSGKVRPDDIEGSTFSISNLGMFDVEHFIAIINPPEAAILAVGSAQKMPVVDGDQLRIGTRMKATISADHRVSDGAEAAQFMQALAKYIEDPMRLML
jgi:pyruvate dehydrogenase E2 component (dihydrolipoamide acetyltransferase)